MRLHIRPEGYLGLRRPAAAAGNARSGVPAPGPMHAALTHDAGCSWPDRVGELFAEEALAAGGAAVLVFATLADALTCRQRLEGAPRP